MSGSVGQLRLRCTARRSGAARAMRARARLEGTARHHLPAALDPALAFEPRVYVDRLDVRLDFALEDYDDVTVATLWAARVRSALERALREGDPSARSFETDDEFVAGAAAEIAERGELSWVFEELGCGTGRVAVLDFLFAFDSRRAVAVLARALSSRPALARALHERLEPGERGVAVTALRGERRWGDRRAGAPTDARLAGREAAAGRMASRETAGVDARRDPQAKGATMPLGERTGDERASGVEAWLEALAECARGGGAAVVLEGSTRPATAGRALGATTAMDGAEAAAVNGAASRYGAGRPAVEQGGEPAPTSLQPVADGRRPDEPLVTRYAGLTLLYPWLGEYLGRELPAPTVPPGLDPRIAARLWALARLVAPEAGGGPAGDPLLWLLAGGSPRASAPVSPPPEEELAELDRPATELLAAFAALVPGFEGSTPTHVRDRFLSREGTFADSEREDEVLLVLRPDALDAVLGRLPYPRGPFRLAWTPVVRVEVGR